MKFSKKFTMKMEKKWILFYERSPSNIILIENTKFFFFFGWVYIYNLSNKKVCVCVYITKKTCVYVCGGYLDKYISAAT